MRYEQIAKLQLAVVSHPPYNVAKLNLNNNLPSIIIVLKIEFCAAK